jgi:DNA-binding NarL/FixJ family response regulator
MNSSTTILYQQSRLRLERSTYIRPITLGESIHSNKIRGLSDFLARQPKSYNEIAQFLVMNTFSEEGFLTVYLGELTETGVVCLLGGFGWDAFEYASFTDLPIQAKLPITEAIRTNEVLVLKNDAEYRKEFPLTTQAKTSVAWLTEVVIPVYPIGGMSLYSAKEITLSESMKVFFVAIGSLLGLYASRLPSSLEEVARNVKKKIDLPQVPLTDRQFVIAGLLEQGFNNAQIAEEISYSESLIRQETVVIYRKLQVTGRKAMQAIRALNLEAAADIEQALEVPTPEA